MEQPGLAEEGTEDDRNHVKYKHRNQTRLVTVKTTASTHCAMWGSACHCTQTFAQRHVKVRNDLEEGRKPNSCTTPCILPWPE